MKPHASEHEHAFLTLYHAVVKQLKQKHALILLYRFIAVSACSWMMALCAVICNYMHVGLVLFAAGLLGNVIFHILSWRQYQTLHIYDAWIAHHLTSGSLSGLESSLFFAHEPLKTSSAVLSLAHVEHYTQLFHAIPWKKHYASYERTQRRRWFFVCLCCLSVSMVTSVYFKTASRQLFRTMGFISWIEFVQEPLMSDLKISIQLPDYLHESEKLIEGSDGFIEAIKNSRVSLFGFSDKPLKQAKIIVYHTQAQTSEHIEGNMLDTHHVQFNLTLTSDADYAFYIKTEDGYEYQEIIRKKIHVIQDEQASIFIDMPSSDIELKKIEPILIQYHASDDYALKRVSLVFKSTLDQKTERIVLKDNLNQKSFSSNYVFNISSTMVHKNTDLIFYLEVSDEDPDAHKNVGVSSSRKISFYHSTKHHEKMVQDEREIVDALTDALAKDLESMSKNNQKQETLILSYLDDLEKKLSVFIQKLEKDTLAQKTLIAAFKSTYARFKNSVILRKNTLQTHTFNEKFYQTLKNKHINQLETDLFYLDSLIVLNRISDLKTSAQDLIESKNELMKLINEYKNTQDPQKKQEIALRIELLKKEMIHLMQEMALLKKSLPTEYQNAEAASNTALEDQMKKIDTSLQSNNIENTAKELEQLANMIENMSQHLDSAESRIGEEHYQETQKMLEDFEQKLNAALTEQESIHKKLQSNDKTSTHRPMQEMAQKELRLSVEWIQKIKPNQSSSRFFDDLHAKTQDHLKNAFDLIKHDVLGSIESIHLAISEMNRMNSLNDLPVFKTYDGIILQSKNHAEKALSLLEKDQEQTKTIEQSSALQQQESKVEELLKKMEERMQQMNETAPIFDEESQKRIATSKEHTQHIVHALKSQKKQEALLQSTQVIKKLKWIQSSLQESKKNQSGVPMPMMSPEPNKRSVGESSSNMQEERVEIPELSLEEEKLKFKQKIIDASKNKTPERYKDSARKYYQDLIQ